MIDQANNKLLTEMEDNKHPSIDKIHVWLNQNMSEELAAGVLKEDKTIITCYKYIEEQARKIAVQGSIMIEDDDVFKLVVDYYTDKNIDIPVVKVDKKEIIPSKPTKQKAKKKKKESDHEQLSLFG